MGAPGVAGVWSSIRYLLADFIGDDDAAPPFLPDGLPDAVAPIASEGIERLIDYQGPGYAQLYVDRLKRFIGRRGVDDVLFGEIARLMALRMSYDDPIRIAQTKLAELDAGAAKATARSPDDIKKFRWDELVGALPAAVADPVLGVLEWMGWLHRPVSIRFSTAGRFGIRRLKIEAGLRRWRLFSVRYGAERVWVERWLHMIDRALNKQPQAAAEIVADRDHGSRSWRRLSPGPCGLAPDHRRPRQADLRRRAGACRILPARSGKPAPPRCPTRGRPR